MAISINQKQALTLWRDALVASVRAEEPDLSARQMAILQMVYLDERPHTVRGLAQKLGVTKPAITRALDTMGRMGLLTRRRDHLDDLAKRGVCTDPPSLHHQASGTIDRGAGEHVAGEDVLSRDLDGSAVPLCAHRRPHVGQRVGDHAVDADRAVVGVVDLRRSETGVDLDAHRLAGVAGPVAVLVEAGKVQVLGAGRVRRERAERLPPPLVAGARRR